jgi:hypothetical protein
LIQLGQDNVQRFNRVAVRADKTVDVSQPSFG